MAGSSVRLALLAASIAAAVPLSALAQSASEVERCFQNGGCPSGGGAPAPAPPPVTASRAAPAPDYTSVLKSPDPDRRKLQESLRTLDKYNGPIDGNLQSEATAKAIAEWQKGHGYAQVGKLTPTEAQTLNAEAAKWYADNKTAGRTIGDITPVVEDYGSAKAGVATTTEVKFDTKQDGKDYPQCLVFAWVEAAPRKETQAYGCDDIAAVEKWKSDQALKSDWR
jgi:hypothetical protein